MTWVNVENVYPNSHLFHKELFWVDKNCNCYFAFKLNEVDDWTFYAGNAAHALDTGSYLTSYGTSEALAQTNYLTTVRDSNGKVLAILPANFQAKYVRIYIESGNTTTIHEWQPSIYITAHEIISGTLEITDLLTDAPLIKVVASSIDRIKIGKVGSAYGLFGYDGSSNKVFEISDSLINIAGWSINAAYLAKDTGIDSTSSGMSPTDFPFYAGSTYANRATAPFRVEPSGALTATSATISGTITATLGYVGGWVVDATSIKDAAGTVGLSSAVTGGDDIRFFAGHVTPASAPFKVTEAGVLTATSGNIGGWSLGATSLTGTGITFSSTGDAYLAIGTTPPTSPTVGTGIFINKTGLFGLNANNPRFKILEDGSGFLGASDVLSWTTAGVTSLSGFGLTASDLTKTASGNTTIVSSGATAFTAGPTGSPTFTVTQAGVLTATSGYIGGATNGWAITAGLLTAIGTGIIQTSATANTGIKLDSTSIRGYNGTAQTINIAADGSGWLGLTGTRALSWTTAGVATIGGYTTTATALYAGTTSTRIQLDTTAGIHLGATAFADAPFRVSLAGDLVATSANITGIITATSGSFTGTVNATFGKFGTSTNYWGVGATGLTATSASTDVIINYGKTDFDNTISGFILGYDFSASAAKFYVGDATSYLNWDGTALTYTKGTLIETIIQMYTSVASLATSATAGDGSANSAGIKITYEGLFGCGANQTATVAAANANVRILATGAAILTDVTLTTSAVNAITVNYGSNVLLKEGGSLRFTSVAAPGACTATLVATGTGNVTDGSHEYCITFVTATGETSIGTTSNSVTVDASHKQIDLTSIPVSSSSSVTARKIYRTLAGGSIHFYLATISDNTTTVYTDNIADGSLGTYSWDTRQNDTFGKIINDSIEVFSVGSTNTLLGYNTAQATNLGKNITFIGANAGYSNTIGGASVAVGGNALYYNITGNYNACVGYDSLKKATASGNAAIGAYSGWAITSGTNNVFLGYGAGQNSQLATATNSVAIGYNTATSASNQIVLGNSSVVETLLQGNILIGITAVGTSAAKVLGIGSGTTPTTAPANIAQLWVEDINAAAGYAGFHMRVETNNTKLVVPGVAIKTDAGQTANPFEGLIEINTNENKIYIYGDAGWRQIATW